MKAIELMIGDWVQETNHRQKGKVTYLDANKDCGRIDIQTVNGGGYPCADDIIVPIPLTPEILEKNGFIYEKIAQSGKIEEYYVNRKNDEIQMLLGCFKGEPYVSIAGTYKKLDYVHQIQHIIHFYGLNALADNFKI